MLEPLVIDCSTFSVYRPLPIPFHLLYAECYRSLVARQNSQYLIPVVFLLLLGQRIEDISYR